MERERFEEFSKPLFDKLNETSNELGWNWCVRDRKNEFFVWNSDRMAHATYVARGEEDWLIVFLSHGTEQATQMPDAAFEMMFGGLSAEAQ